MLSSLAPCVYALDHIDRRDYGHNYRSADVSLDDLVRPWERGRLHCDYLRDSNRAGWDRDSVREDVDR